jgi:hypothetical protein
MKSTLSLLLCVLAVAGVYSDVNSTAYLLVSRGIIEGISSVKGWSDITSCISNYEGITTGISDAFATFQPNNSDTIAPASIKLGKALQKIPLAVRSCNNSIKISQNLVKNVSSFASLKDYIQIVGNNIATYHVDVVRESYQAAIEYSQGRLKEFGNKVGQALAQVFLNGTSKTPIKPSDNSTSPYLLITQGVLEGIDSGLRWNQIKPCIKETGDSYNNLNIAFQYFQAGDPVSIIQGLAALGVALENVPAAVKDCTGSYTKAANLVNAIAALQDAATYLSIVGKNVVINGNDIYDAVSSTVEAFNAAAWKEFGTNAGIASSKLLLDNIVEAKRSLNFLEIDA